MARSVSTPSGAAALAYADAAWIEEFWEFDDAVERLQELAQERYPSLQTCDTWLGREDRAVLENGFCYITVSEYRGLVAVAAVPKADGLAARWCASLDLKALAACFGDTLVSLGRFSNGEQVFRRSGQLRGETISSNGSRW